MTNQDTVKACPHCDEADWEPRDPTNYRGTKTSAEEPYRCNRCNRNFDEYVVREARGHTEPGVGSALVAELAAMDASEVTSSGD